MSRFYLRRGGKSTKTDTQTQLWLCLPPSAGGCGNSTEMCISDAIGRFHGDVNSDSLLVQPDRCGIAKEHRQE